MPVAGTLIPLAASAIGSFMGRRSAKKASEPGPQEQAATSAQQGVGQSLATSGRQQTAYGQPLQQQAGSYFSSLAGGDRAKMTATLSPEISAINDTYGGTRRNLRRFLRGPDRDFQLGELERQRAGGIASLFRTARSNANEVVGRLGADALGRGAAETEAAGGIFANLAQRGFANRYAGEDLQRQAGYDYGSLFSQLATGAASRMGGGGTPRITSMPAGWTGGT